MRCTQVGWWQWRSCCCAATTAAAGQSLRLPGVWGVIWTLQIGTTKATMLCCSRHNSGHIGLCLHLIVSPIPAQWSSIWIAVCSRPDLLLQRKLKLQIFSIGGMSLLTERNEVGGNTTRERETERLTSCSARKTSMTSLTVLVAAVAPSPMASHRSCRNEIAVGGQRRQCQQLPD